jgi:uncharacterized damage-inducible protein DinB
MQLVRPDFVLDSWKTVRRNTAQAVLDMPQDRLDFQPSGDLMTFRELAIHVLDSSHALAGLLIDGVTDMTAPDFRQRMKTYFLDVPADASQQALADLLNSTLEQDCQALAARPDDFHGEIITKFDGARLTRLEMVQFTKEHELTHRSQMFLYLRLNGVVPPTTRSRQGKR